ncbi:MAG: hypothetical protein WCA15_09110 [Candidatus Acidiferrales bacterium]
MKMIRKVAISLALVWLTTPLISAQNLASYRKFALGTSLAALSKQIGQDPHQATLIHQSPAVIQELKYWPVETSYSAVPAEPVSQILFSFYNGELYRIAVTYDQNAIEGMTEDDLVRAVSARYGTGTRLYPEINLPTLDPYMSPEKIVARWDDPQSSVILFRANGLDSFGLVVSSKRLDAEADAAIAESVKLDDEQAPQKEIDRQKKVADDLDTARLKNIKTFRP